jgi:hypothetical protein
MKFLSLAFVLMFSVAAQAQTMSNITVELSKKIDTKSAHVGDAVEVKTTAAATLPDGTPLPKGSKLTGKLTEVRAKSNTDKTARLAFTLDKAVLHDGHEVAIHTTLAAMSVPSLAADNSTGTVSADTGMPALRGTGGGQPTSTLSAGASRSTQQVAPQVRTAVGNGVDGTGLPTVTPPQIGVEPVVTNTPGNAPIKGPHMDHVAVGFLPGVTFSSAIYGNETATLDATGQNISVEGGAKMVLVMRAP